MLIAKRTMSSFYVAGLLALSLIGGSGGCASTNENTNNEAEGALTGPKPPPSCEQYLALLSEERKQPLLAQYGAGGSCWTGSKEQAAQCEATCSQGVNEIIRGNLHKNNE